MAISLSAAIGFNFTSGLGSTAGPSVTATLVGGATLDANGVLCSAGADRVYADLIGANATAMKLTLPFTIFQVSEYVGSLSESVYNISSILFALMRLVDADASYQCAVNISINSGGNYWSISHDNGTSTDNVDVLTRTTSSFRSAGVKTRFLEVRSNGFTYWEDATSVEVNTAKSWTDTSYGTDIRLYMGGGNAGATGPRGWYAKHFAAFQGTLTGADRTALVANPLAYLAASGPNASALTQYRQTHLLMEP